LRQSRPFWPSRLQLVVFDFDGVMTDNTVTVHSDGTESVVCHRGDGLGIERLRAAAVPILVLSKERNPIVSVRCQKLGLFCLQGVDDKLTALLGYLSERGVNARDVAYVGNDINDAECLSAVGLPVVVGDAHPSVVPLAALVLIAHGGRGAVREFCDLAIAHYGL
jgi:YrbI family 3-deoxy-D-manno-octulosonate 8-phosphate phosphatase